MRFANYMMKGLVLGIAATTFSLFGISSLRAQDSSSSTLLLQIIAYNTSGILKVANMIPTYLDHYMKVAISLLIDDSVSSDTAHLAIHPPFITNNQGSFAQLGSLFTDNASKQNNLTLQLQMAADLLKVPLTNLQGSNIKAPSILATLPTVNNLLYPNLFSPTSPLVIRGAYDPYNYVKNVAGLSLFHFMPLPTYWKGSTDSVQRYINYYNTVMAISSFDGYILSNLSIDGKQTTELQNKLILAASNSQPWLLQIATEELGKVLRQILLFESQSYVLLNELLQVERQQLYAQVMANTLAITNNQLNETLLLAQARGTLPSA